MTHNPNPLDSCGRSQLQCDSPCFTGQKCDLLPTQIDTFATQFFGNALGKSLSGGDIVWSLPCGLDVGTAANPRLPGESLACYFLRLFEAGIPGTIGPQGEPGLPGACGLDAYTITLQDFRQPTLQNPYVAVTTRPGFSLVAGLPVEIQNSGYYIVQDAELNGATLLQLTQPFVGAPATIPAGAIVVASGLPGAVVKGPQGSQGLQGIQGAMGPVGPVGGKGLQGDQGSTIHLTSGTMLPGGPTLLPNTNTYVGPVGAVFNAPDTSAATYFVVFMTGLSFFNGAAGPPSITGAFRAEVKKVVNGVDTGAIDGSEHGWNIPTAGSTEIATGYVMQIPVLVSNTAGNTLQLKVVAKGTLSGSADMQGYATGSLFWMRL